MPAISASARRCRPGFSTRCEQGYDFVVRQDGDGQHDPSQIPRLLEPLERDEADIVVGSRFLAREGYQSTVVRRVGIFILGIVSALVGTRITDPTSGYWAVNRRALKVLARSQPDDYPETEALVLASRAGCRVRELPVDHVRAHRRPLVDQRHVLGLLYDEGGAGVARRPVAPRR